MLPEQIDFDKWWLPDPCAIIKFIKDISKEPDIQWTDIYMHVYTLHVQQREIKILIVSLVQQLSNYWIDDRYLIDDK